MSQPSGKSPELIIIAGPNGAGKSTSAPLLLQDSLHVPEFVNADTIAKGLSGFSPSTASVSAGRIMLDRLHELAEARRKFAFETTLASKTFAPWLQALQNDGYHVRLIFLWLASPEMAVDRVRQRVKSGGHDVERATILRRYERGLTNFFGLYRPIVDDWRMYNGAAGLTPRLIAAGDRSRAMEVADAEVWNTLMKTYDHA